MPAASGLTNFARITAGAFGTSITTTLWDNRAAMHHAELAESINNASMPTTQALLSSRRSDWVASKAWPTSTA